MYFFIFTHICAHVAPSEQINSNKTDGVYGIGEEILINVYLSTPVVSD